jgi:PAS domain S-box-containing protein
VVAVLIIVLGTWLIVDRGRSLKNSVSSDLLSICELKVAQIADWRAARLADAARLHSNLRVSGVVDAWTSSSDAADKEDLLGVLQREVDAYHYAGAMLVDMDGNVLLQAGPWAVDRVSASVMDDLRQAASDNQPVMTDLHVDTSGGDIHVSVIAPLQPVDSGGGRIGFCIVLVSNAKDFLFPLIQGWPITSKTAETLLVRREGNSVLFLNEVRHQTDTALKLKIPLTRTDVPAVRAATGTTGFVEGTDYRGVKVLAAIGPVPGSPWFVVAKVDASEALGPARIREGLIGGLVAIIFLALVGGAALVWQWGLKRQYAAAYEAESARSELAQRFEHLFMAANDCIVLADGQRRVLEVNNKAMDTYGYSREEFLELRLLEMEQSGASVHEITAWRKDGSSFPIEVSDRTFAMGGRTFIQAIIRDNTSRKQSEDALRAAGERYKATVEALAQIVWVTNPLGDVVEPLPELERYTGLSEGEIRAGGLWAAVHPDDADRVGEVWNHALANRSRFEVDCRMLGADSVYRHFWVRGLPTFAGDGQVVEWVGACTDITEHRRMEEERFRLERQLQHSQRLESLGVLAGGIAHDFNNILTAVLGHADLALHDMPLSSPGRQGVQEIVIASRRASELCRQMLAYSGRGRFVVEEMDLPLLVEDMVGLLGSVIPKKILLNLNLDKNLPHIKADVSQINQIIMNLVINAAEAIGDRSGVITISAGAQMCSSAYLVDIYYCENLKPGLYVTLEVSDTGTGMDKQTLGRLFEPFFTTKFTGRGLGLSAVLGIVRGHEGGLRVYSEPGKGTTFKILFPALESGNHALGGQGTAVEASWVGEGTVLLVDDEETIRALAGRMLERLGFKVLTAADGREGLELFRTHQDEIVLTILDLTMPHMNGEEAFREIRAISPEARVLMSSGYAENEIVSRFAGKGTAGFIQKPYTLATLRERVGTALGLT